MHVLVVDDDSLITEALRDALATEGYIIRTAHDAAGCLSEARTWRPDIILLDIMMPGGMTGLDALRILRRESNVPVILMSARGRDHDKVLGLEYADDYVVKPFSSVEILARVRAVMRRTSTRHPEEPAGTIVVGDLTINAQTHEVHRDGRAVSLTPTEFRVLLVLTGRAGRLYTRQELIAGVWGGSTLVDPKALDVHIHGLRHKIEADPSNPAHVVNVRGEGFRYVP